jgi:hypothetical protein
MSYQVITHRDEAPKHPTHFSNNQSVRFNLSELSRRLRPDTTLAVLDKKGVVTGYYLITHSLLSQIGLQFAEHAYMNFATNNCHEETRDAMNILRQFALNPGVVNVDDVYYAAEHADDASDVHKDDMHNRVDFRVFKGAYSAADEFSTDAITTAAFFALVPFLTPDSSEMDKAENAEFREIAQSAAMAAARRSGGCRAEYVRQGEFIMEYLRAGNI